MCHGVVEKGVALKMPLVFRKCVFFLAESSVKP